MHCTGDSSRKHSAMFQAHDKGIGTSRFLSSPALTTLITFEAYRYMLESCSGPIVMGLVCSVNEGNWF